MPNLGRNIQTTKLISAFMFILVALLTPHLVLQAFAQSTGILTINQAVELALQNNRDIALARVQYTIAQNQAGVYRSEFRPNLYTGSGAAYTSGFPATPGGQLPALFSMSYTQSIFNLPLRGQVKAAEERAQSLRIELDRTRDEVTVRVATVYLELAKVRHSLKLLETERLSEQKILDIIHARVAEDVELPIEITRVELDLARTEHRIVQLEVLDHGMSERLRSLTRLPADQPLEVASVELQFPEQHETSQLIAHVVENDPLVKEAEHERSARERIMKGEKGGLWPTVDLIGLYQILGKFNNYSKFYNPNSFQRNNVTIGVDVRIPIFSARRSPQTSLARSQFQAAELSLDNRREVSRQDVEQHLRNLRELDAAKKVARLGLKLAQETLHIIQAKYDEDRGSVRELELARIEENEKWLDLLEADCARQKEALLLFEKTGQLELIFK